MNFLNLVQKQSIAVSLKKEFVPACGDIHKADAVLSRAIERLSEVDAEIAKNAALLTDLNVEINALGHEESYEGAVGDRVNELLSKRTALEVRIEEYKRFRQARVTSLNEAKLAVVEAEERARKIQLRFYDEAVSNAKEKLWHAMRTPLLDLMRICEANEYQFAIDERIVRLARYGWDGQSDPEISKFRNIPPAKYFEDHVGSSLVTLAERDRDAILNQLPVDSSVNKDVPYQLIRSALLSDEDRRNFLSVKR